MERVAMRVHEACCAGDFAGNPYGCCRDRTGPGMLALATHRTRLKLPHRNPKWYPS